MGNCALRSCEVIKVAHYKRQQQQPREARTAIVESLLLAWCLAFALLLTVRSFPAVAAFMAIPPRTLAHAPRRVGRSMYSKRYHRPFRVHAMSPLEYSKGHSPHSRDVHSLFKLNCCSPTEVPLLTLCFGKVAALCVGYFVESNKRVDSAQELSKSAHAMHTPCCVPPYAAREQYRSTTTLARCRQQPQISTLPKCCEERKYYSGPAARTHRLTARPSAW